MVVVFSLTERGRRVSERVGGLLSEREHEVRRCCFYKHSDDRAESFTSLSEMVRQMWGECRGGAMVFVCACGIAVRCIAPNIRSKQTDPAVIVIDDMGKFVIPILSGHLGGANKLAKGLAEQFGGQAVITTATDIGGLFSPDSYAAAAGLAVSDFTAAKELAAAAADGEQIGFISECAGYPTPEGLAAGAVCRCGIVISERADGGDPFPVTLRLLPKNIVLGVGCRRGATKELISEAVRTVFAAEGLDTRRICRIITIDIKADEQGLTDFCAEMGIKPEYRTADELNAVEGDFTHSDFVLKTVGTDNVCERSALSGGGRLIIRKTKINGVTIAAVLPHGA